MVTIIGNGVGDYDFSRIELDLSSFDKVVCYKDFKEDRENVLKLDYKETKKYLLDNGKDLNILYVVTGSPLFFSAGTLIGKALEKENIPYKIIDNQSSKSYILSHFGISESNCGVLSLHGRERVDLCELLAKEYTFVLCDEKSIGKLREVFCYLEPKDLRVYLGYKLGFKEEKIEEIDLFSCEEFENPYVLLIKKEFQAHKKISEDEEFEKDRGMITKSYKRHLALQFLDLEPNQTLWDIGAGSGSVGIDGYKRYKIQTVFFEKNEKRCEDIEKNLSKHKVLDTKLYRGNAIGNFEKEEKNPDRIFIGGGADEVLKKLPYLYERLAEKGVIVINLVTLKTLTIALKTLEENQIEFQVQSLSLTNYKTNLLLGENSRELFIVKINK